MIVAIEVTIEDVVDGVPESECSCAIALAMKRALPGRTVEVYDDEFFIDGFPVKAPEAATAFIRVFDKY
ncbi:MAG TPA: hypothetical protein VLT58_19135, partial [Polyangia bacterium]|nr:hypothetical protein [Polyangia bacterium]